MYEFITDILIFIIASYALLIAIIGKTFKNRIDKNEAAITEIFKEYATKNEVNTSVNRIIDQLNRIENKLDHKKDK